jgi:hypothetical protein
MSFWLDHKRQPALIQKRFLSKTHQILIKL